MRGNLSRSPVIRFFGVWFVTKEKRATFAALTIVFLFACFFTRAARLNVKYAALNPVRDAEVWKRISEGSSSPEIDEILRSGSLHHAETLYLPPPAVLKILSMGYLENLADLLFVRAHSYFLTHFFSDRIFNWLDLYVDRIISLDPNNPRVYLWAAQVVKYGQIIDNNIIVKANR
ncbi:MAG: hypothetical protein FJ088_15795, partial [Deltaproteobacteria bacterium]|nr:hypothetical protein [Deltaproteobacteria bacterium]